MNKVPVRPPQIRVQSVFARTSRPCQVCAASARRNICEATAVINEGSLSIKHPVLSKHRDHLRQTKPPPLPRLSKRQLQAPSTEPSTPSQNGDEERASKSRQQPHVGCPVFVMLPLDSVAILRCEGRTLSEVQSSEALDLALDKIARAKVQGVMVDVWWGIVERDSPKQYDFSGYRDLFERIRMAGLEIQAVMSFHAAGTNVGDTCTIPLPQWVQAIGDEHPDIFYTDAAGIRNRECLSLGCFQHSVLDGRTPREVYTDFISEFATSFSDMMGDVVTEITVGMGPAGELRYPSYPEGDRRWRFPGVGEFQCYDRYMLSSLRAAADAIGEPDWGMGGPHDAGGYNSRFWDTGFFSDCGRWRTPYGEFFLKWYSQSLLDYADSFLAAVGPVLQKRCPGIVLDTVNEAVDSERIRRGNTHAQQQQQPSKVYSFKPRYAKVKLGIKLAGVHWCSKSLGHAAELTAGYYNTAHHNGYKPIMQMLSKHNAQVSFTCVEMRDCEQPDEAACGPEALLQLVIDTASAHGVAITGENALQRYDKYAFDRMYQSAVGASAASGRLQQLTFLRMGNQFLDNWDAFNSFMARMRGGD